jgi:hypothetical protein
VTAGLFSDASGREAVLLVNRDYKRAIDVSVHVRAGERVPERFDAETREWSASGAASIRLAAGGAVLLRWKP